MADNATPKEPQPVERKSKPAKVNPERVRAVLEEVSLERLANARKIQKLETDLQAKNKVRSERLRPLMTALDEAKADLAAHDRYKHKMVEAEWAEERRDLLAAQDAAQKGLDTEREATVKEMQPIQVALQPLYEKANNLSREWTSHTRRAEKAGVDVAEFWTPEMGIPDDAEVQAAAEEIAAEEAAPAPQDAPEATPGA